MLTFIIRRLLWTVLVMFVITVLVFVIFFKTPGVDPARAVAGRNPSAQVLNEVREQFGLNRPLPVQYGLMMKSIFVSRDLVSYSNQGVRVVPEVAAATPATLSLVFGAAFATHAKYARRNDDHLGFNHRANRSYLIPLLLVFCGRGNHRNDSIFVFNGR